MNDKLNNLLTKKDKLLRDLEVIYEQIALERIMMNETVSQKQKRINFETKARNKFRIK